MERSGTPAFCVQASLRSRSRHLSGYFVPVSWGTTGRLPRNSPATSLRGDCSGEQISPGYRAKAGDWAFPTSDGHLRTGSKTALPRALPPAALGPPGTVARRFQGPRLVQNQAISFPALESADMWERRCGQSEWSADPHTSRQLADF